METSKWLSRKWLVGITAFALLIVLSLLEANTAFVFPSEMKYILGAITMTWLVMEGFIDSKTNSSTLTSTTQINVPSEAPQSPVSDVSSGM